MWRRWINPDYLVYIVLRLGAMIFQMFPIDWNLATARWMGWMWFRIMRRHRERALEHLRFAYGDQLTDAERRRLALASMQQMTMVAMETFFTTRLINEWTWPRYVRLKGVEPGLEVLTRRRGAILVTGHYGSWELCGYVLATMGFPIVAVMRPLDNPYINSYLMDVRAKRGLQLLYKKGVSRSADEVLAGGGTLAFIADQNAGHKGLFVDFFGRKASTYKSIALLAIQHQVPIIVGYARRVSKRFEYELGVSRVIEPAEWSGRDDELMWITQEYTRAIENFIREDPGQYLWIHRRWKSRPKDETAQGGSDGHASAPGQKTAQGCGDEPLG
ncbi:MAG TPA: lysophospholipid acyltransferase family protein [Phycisphaerae bacterium]|nr:lysophospholipid acyltransferase family protein [Phycisphaerae bacterium]HPP27579.1 lysophospholipid acyltransferase family protein [Phycisphaerae bacterium]HPU25234.1 lysophospholipid acyltransferase family protein [Phycisphaerae bacterium]HPZ99720.1 lysophospholipid acyltransferase family protein [Phycisphaerae bacterium]HQE28904.1 lysophospholipid acyltransferase family protein [Phycisphaerae bacterium]